MVCVNRKIGCEVYYDKDWCVFKDLLILVVVNNFNQGKLIQLCLVVSWGMENRSNFIENF